METEILIFNESLGNDALLAFFGLVMEWNGMEQNLILVKSTSPCPSETQLHRIHQPCCRQARPRHGRVPSRVI